jgi:signal transduction histidine kinase
VTAAKADRTQRLASALRAGAARAADEVGGGLALVFAGAGDSAADLRLRAAAGFALAEDAREAARSLLGPVGEALKGESPRPVEADDVLGERAAAGLLVFPLRFGERVHGALAVGAPAALQPPQKESLCAIADELALRFDHLQVEDERDELMLQIHARDQAEEEKSDEVLRLSEALFAQDIELLRSNEKLGKIERLKNDFIEKMSRELRTPLNSIIEAIISVLTGEDESLSESAKTALRSALDDGTAFLRTLQNILDLWRIKQGELPVEIQDVNFRELVDEAIFSIQDAIGDKPLSVRKELVEPFPRIRTDLAKVNQILFLLLDNAAKFTPQGEIEIHGEVDGGRLVCSVRDSGVGICPDDQQFVFDEFFQVDDPASRKYRGAGLGLALVRDLIILLDGDVSITSEVGRGTTVRFQVPVQML